MIKKIYRIPQIEVIELDNEIALVLESNPPAGPDETKNSLYPYYQSNDQFKNLLV